MFFLTHIFKFFVVYKKYRCGQITQRQTQRQAKFDFVQSFAIYTFVLGFAPEPDKNVHSAELECVLCI